MKEKSYNEWKSIADQAYKVESELIKLMELSNEKVTATISNHIIEAHKNIREFKSESEEHMINSGIVDLNLFFGRYK